MVKGMLGFTSIQTYIDMHTLLFLGSLCRLQPEDTWFKLFIHRLYQHRTSVTTLSKGFITDIVFILHNYRLFITLKNLQQLVPFHVNQFGNMSVKTQFVNMNNICGHRE